MSNISTVIKSIQDVMRQDSGVDGDAQRISQLTWLLFLKVFDAQEEELELTRNRYKSPIPEDLRWRNWASDAEGITGDALLNFVNGDLFPKLKTIAGDAERNPRGFVVRSVFEDAYNYMKSGQLLRQVINKLNAIDFNRQAERHQFNDLYEKILKDLQSAGNAGEFYTPRAVTQFMVDMVNPRLGEVVLDPACGTGGFLVCTLEHLREQVRNEHDQETLQRSVRGVEKKQLPHMLCTTNMMLHGVEVPSLIAHDNTLTRPLRDYGAADRVDVIITNPPFGGVEEPGTENNFPADVRTKETADLFLVLIKHLLKPGGRCALVLPDSTLFGEGVKTRIKEQLLAECNLHTIVRLPNGVFSPYTGIKTNLLFFTNGQPTKEIWYYEHQYPTDVKNYNKTKPIRIEEFDVEKAWWNNRVENEFAWKVSVDDIKARNYNLDIKNPHSPNQVDHDADELLADYARMQVRIATTRDQLKTVLATALEGQHLAEYFDTLFTTEPSVDALQQAILQLAVMGKLLPQDPNDEPASKLLKRIGQERARLEADGTYKKAKSMPLLSDAEVPYVLPHSWVWTRLGEITNFGQTNKDGKINEGTWVLDLEDIQKESSVLLQKIRFAERKSKSDKNRFQSGDVLYGKLRPYLNKVIVADEDGVCTTEILPVRGFCGVTPRFLMYALKRPDFLLYANTKSYGMKMPRLGTEDGRLALFPLPPEAEQYRIVAKVDELMVLCDRLKADLAESRHRQVRLTSTLIELALKAA